MKRTFVIVLSLVILGGCGSSGDGGSRAQDHGLTCFVSVPPLAYFVERVGGELVDVHVMIGPGQSPATYEPTPKQMARLKDSDVFFGIGVPFEARLLPLLQRSAPELQFIQTHRYGIANAWGYASLHIDPESFDSQDPHIWLSPLVAVDVVGGIESSLAWMDSANAGAYAKNASELKRDLRELERDVRAVLMQHDGKAIYVFHPAFGQLVGRYGIRQVAIEKHGVVPGSRHVATVIDSARSGRARAVFVQPEFSSTSAENVADAVGAKIVRLDPLSEDYLNNIRYMTAQIDAALQGARRQFPPRSRGILRGETGKESDHDG